MSLYTIVVWADDPETGSRIRTVLNPDLRLPWNWADQKAAELNGRYGPDRIYKAVSCKDEGLE